MDQEVEWTNEGKEWSGRVDLNHRPPGPETRALLRAKSFHATVILKIKPLALGTGCVRLCRDGLA
jgi:hypothetical protein